MDDVSDYSAEELENIGLKYGSNTFESFVPRAVSLRDTFAIPSDTFEKGVLIEPPPPSNPKAPPRRMIESKAADTLAPALAPWIAWDPEAGAWYCWRGTHWEAQTNPGQADKVIAMAVHAGCDYLGYRPTYLNGVTLLLQRRHLLRLPTFPAGTIPFKNGLLHIATGRLRPATPERSLDWCLPHEHDPEADCPTIRAWLHRNVEGDGATVEMLRAWLAALLRGMPLQKFMVLIGRGGTGKGTFQRLALALVGEKNAAISALRDLEENRFETAKLYGKRLCMINEAGRHGGSINMLKAVTGQDHIPLERKHVQQSGSFVFGGLVLMASNEDLQTTDSTSGLERRRLTVRFPVSATPEERADWQARGGEAKVLHSEIPGLINWCLELTVEEIRDRIESPPERVVSDNILGMAAGNSVADWLLECCDIAPESWAQIGTKDEYRTGDGRLCHGKADEWLYSSYLSFCQEQGRRNPVSLKRFATTVIDIGEVLGHRLVKAQHPIGRYAAIRGLALRSHRQEVADDDKPF